MTAMSHSRINIDDRELERFCSGLQQAATRKVFLRSVRKGMNLLARDTATRFKRLHPGYKQKERYRRLKDGRWKKEKGKIATVATRKRENVVMVHIMGDYRAKWFEKGTRARFTRSHRIIGGVRRGKGHRSGRIRPEWFFKMAQVATARQVENKISSEIKKEITKQVKK